MLRSKFVRLKHVKGFSGILIKDIDWKNKTASFHIASGIHSTDIDNFKLGDHTIISPVGSKYDFTVLTNKESIVISVLDEGETLFEKEINFEKLKII